MDQCTIQDVLIADVFSRLTGTGGPLNGALLLLLKSLPSGRKVAASELDEADFPGYAPVVLSWSSSYLDENDIRRLVADDNTFICTGSANPQRVVAFAVTNAAKTSVYAVGRLQEMVNMDMAGRGVNVQPVISWPYEDAF